MMPTTVRRGEAAVDDFGLLDRLGAFARRQNIFAITACALARQVACAVRR
jgi:hypothetical protein